MLIYKLAPNQYDQADQKAEALLAKKTVRLLTSAFTFEL